MSLKKLDTNYYLRRSIIREITAWKNGQNPPLLTYADTDLYKAIMEQRMIGWKQFLEGLISIKLIDYQKEYYTNSKSKRHIKTWKTRVI